MALKIATLFILIASITACNVQEQVRTLNQIIAPAGNGDVATTIVRLDTTDNFKHPIVNRKFKSYRKEYNQRFVENLEANKSISENKVINDICAFYQEYWRMKMMQSPQNCDSILYEKLASYLITNKLTKQPYEDLISTIKNDEELTRVIEQEGFYCKFFLINGIQDLVIWDKQSITNYPIELPDDKINVDVVFIENYILKGASDYATFGHAQIGGWANNNKASLFCNKGTYKLNSEKFDISYLKHEALHFVDIEKYPNLESADLEYRAKLVELSYCTEKTIYQRINEFIAGASNEDRANSHPYANYYLIHQLSELLFEVPFESDLAKWKTIAVENINRSSLLLLNTGTKLLNETPSMNQVIESINNMDNDKLKELNTLNIRVISLDEANKIHERTIQYKPTFKIADSLLNEYQSNHFLVETKEPSIYEGGLSYILDLFRIASNYKQTKKCRARIDTVSLLMEQEMKAEEAEMYQKIITTAEEHYAQGNKEKAMELYRRAVKLKPSDLKAKMRLKELLEE